MKIECPKCKTGVLVYGHDEIGGEVEYHYCNNFKSCNAEFFVDIEIVRDFDNMQEVKRCNT